MDRCRLNPSRPLRAALALFACVPPAGALAQGLAVGSPAPPMAVRTWVKGKPIQTLEPGKTYVVEFWATWCGPCVSSIPHVTQLAKQYAGKVTFAGVAVWETGDALRKVMAFVSKMGARMGYNVAVDTQSGAMASTWMKAAGQDGIPCAFIISKEGRIAWIGHPMRMEKPLADVVAGRSIAATPAGAGASNAGTGSAADPDLQADQVVYLTNLERRRAGLPPLKSNPALAKAAMDHARNMAASGFFEHTDPQGRDPSERARAAGYPEGCGENIAMGQRGPADSIASWMRSPGHKGNILGKDYREMGAGFARSGKGVAYWVQMFAGRDVLPVILDNENPATSSRKVKLYLYGAGAARSYRVSWTGSDFGPPQPFAPEVDVEMPEGAGTKTVTVEMRDAAGRTVTSSDTIMLRDPSAPGAAGARAADAGSAGRFEGAPPVPDPTEGGAPPPPPAAGGAPPPARNAAADGALAGKMEARAVELINEARRAARLREFAQDDALKKAAERHCRDMVRTRSLDATGSDGSSLDARVAAAGWKGGITYQICAIGSDFAGDIIDAWLLRDTRARRMLSRPAFKSIGVAMSPDGTSNSCWVVVLGE
ncbi:MAG: CAP domain-containing protein [Armatimonadetes bacterium]|nr:CAP domain-containing protein [Armatimonadota bacterium]